MAPQSTSITLKLRKQKKRLRHICEARVLTCKLVKEGLKKPRQRSTRDSGLQRRRRLQERSSISSGRSLTAVLPAKQAACTEIYTVWAATKRVGSYRILLDAGA